ITEYCENGSLDKFLLKSGSNEKLDEFRIWKILIEVLAGLNFLHSNNILHLDIKPANIFINFEGWLKIGDFGLSTKLDNEFIDNNKRSIIRSSFEKEGDREYIAPEILLKSEYGKPADIFSLGLMMVEIAANIYLPDNGLSWQKLRSGDLSDAGNLSSRDLNLNSLKVSSTMSTTPTSKSYNSRGGSSHLTLTNMTNITADSSINLFSSLNDVLERGSKNFGMGMGSIVDKQLNNFIKDGETLDLIVHWMIEPNPTNRPSTEELLNLYELQYIELRRKAGAIVYEGEYGPKFD
ncbi:kinase-like protein, partial [Ascoidea rubescens DSM 1968]